MRKIYVIVLMLLVVGTISAQKNRVTKMPKKQANVAIQKVGTHQEVNHSGITKSIDANLSENFDLTAWTPAGWDTIGTPLDDSNAPSGWANSASFASFETAANPSGHFAYFDCFLIPIGGVSSLVTPVLHPIAGNNTLTYKANYYLLNSNYIDAGTKLYIEFSTNGTTWTTSTTNVLAPLPNYNTASTGWQTLTVDLSSYNGGAVQVRFRAVSDYGGFGLGIDDVTGPEADILTSVNDIMIANTYIDFSGMSYYASTPISQLGAINFGAAVSNIGSAAQTNVTLTANGNNGIINVNAGTNNPVATLAAGANDTLWSELTSPAATATFYDIAFNVNGDQTDENPANNIDSAWFMTDSVLYMRAGNWNQLLTSYSFGTGAPAITGMEFGANYHLLADAIVDNIFVPVYKTGGNPTVTGKLYAVSLTDGSRTLIGQTDPYTVTPTGEDAIIPLQTPTSVPANSIITVTAQLNLTAVGTDTVYLYQDGPFYGDPQQGACYIQVSGAWNWYYLTGKMPAVGLTIQNTVGTSTVVVNNSVVLYPNPTTGILNITNAENATVSVFNMLGQQVMSLNNVKSIDMSNMANGSYFVKVQTSDNVITKKINLVK